MYSRGLICLDSSACLLVELWQIGGVLASYNKCNCIYVATLCGLVGRLASWPNVLCVRWFQVLHVQHVVGPCFMRYQQVQSPCRQAQHSSCVARLVGVLTGSCSWLHVCRDVYGVPGCLPIHLNADPQAVSCVKALSMPSVVSQWWWMGAAAAAAASAL